jgi:hypothetical protein
MISATFADEVKIKTQVSRSSDTAGKALSLARNDANGYGRNYTPQTVTVKHINGQYTAVILFTYTTPVINKKYKIGNTILEMTSSLMLFPADSRHIGDLYVECVKNTVEPVHFLLEQRTWSVVWACLGAKGYMLPITMNWSRLYGEENADVYVRHYHGNEKWTKK